MSCGWRIELFGQLRVTGYGREITHFRTNKTGALLAFLAYHLNQVHARETLVELLWPEDDFKSGGHRLSVALSSLRGQLATDELGERSILPPDRGPVCMRSDGVSTDVRQFESLLASVGPEPFEAHDEMRVRQALELYRQPLLPGYYEDWIHPAQRHLEFLYFNALQRLTTALTARGEHEAAIDYLLQGLRNDPLREDMHLLTIEAYHAMGNTSQALRHFKEMEQLFEREQFGPPSAATVRAVQAIQSRRHLAEISPKTEARSDLKGAQVAPSKPHHKPAGETWGAVPLDSEYYVTRTEDNDLREAVEDGSSIVLLKGPRQVGKTSLLARGMEHARGSGARVAFTDLQLLNSAQLRTVDTLLLALARSISEQLGADSLLSETWDESYGGSANLRRFIRRALQVEADRRLVWALDEADRLFNCAYADEVFAMFRAWHNERALEPQGPWRRLTVIVTYAAEPQMVVSDDNHSPFNVGIRIELYDFSGEQVSELNRRYRRPLRDDVELGRFVRLVGGHPYLVRRGLDEMRRAGLSINDLEREATRDDWIYGEHLRRLHAGLARDAGYAATLHKVIAQSGRPSEIEFHRLRSAGILKGASARDCRMRCALYERYLQDRLDPVD